MKVRYFLLPIVIISVMVLVIKSNREVVNKMVLLSTMIILMIGVNIILLFIRIF